MKVDFGCKAIDQTTKDPCVRVADRTVHFRDDTTVRCCSDCAFFFEALAQEHRTRVRVVVDAAV